MLIQLQDAGLIVEEDNVFAELGGGELTELLGTTMWR